MNEKYHEFSTREKFRNDFIELKKVLEVLKGLGFALTEYTDEIIQSQWDDGNTFPIVNDGAQGIRVTRWRRGGITISFTNDFEDTKNPRRIEATEELRKKGINVV